MKNLIIGGSGFVGSRLLSEIDRQSFINLDKNNSPFYEEITKIGDITRLNEIESTFKNVKTVVLLAAEHRDDVSPTSLYYDVNVEGTKNVLRAMDRYNVKNLIFTSSVAVYGLNKDNPNERHPIDPFNHYGKSKWKAEKVIKDWFDSDTINKSVTILRPTVIFGERNRGNVYNLLKQIYSGKFVMIGKGKNKKSMAYVGNIVSFIIEKINKSKLGYNVYNYADKPDLNMNQLNELIHKTMNINSINFSLPYSAGMLIGYFFDLISFLTRKKTLISSVRVKKFCATTQFDSSKVKKEFTPPYSLEQGLNNTLNHEFINPVKDDVLFYSE